MKRVNSLLMVIFLLLILDTYHQACTSAQYSFNGVCSPCHVTCVTCNSGSSTSCLTCTNNRTLSSQKACQCNDGHIQNNPVSATCAQLTCNYKCVTCNNSVTTCTTCRSLDNRILVSSSKTCPCISKFFENGTATCIACHYTCGECTNNTIFTCSSCQTSSFRTIQANMTCLCNDGFYDDGSAYICLRCFYKCATCITSDINCLTCGADRNATPTCLCNTNFYDDGTSSACISCHYSCSNCNNGSACILCDATKFRTSSSLSTVCVCLDQYYDSGVLLCASCDIRCATCNINTQCLTCNTTAFRIYNSNNKFCDCRIGFYEVSTTTEECGICNSRCLTCSGPALTQCLTCDLANNRIISTTSCICNIGFFENTFETCSACHTSCYTCTNVTQCLTCRTTTLQVRNTSLLCSCTSISFYNTTSIKCQACNYKCRQCVITTSTNCTSCPTSSFRTYSLGTCPCNTYYYDDGTSICKRCHYSCLTCTSNTTTTCLTCTTAAKRVFLTSSCLCITLFYDNGALEVCQPCRYNCLTCTNATGCTTCNVTLFRVLDTVANPQTCACMLYYFQNSNLTCSRCFYNCHTCNNLLTCLTCSASIMFRQHNISTNNCDCMVKYYDDFVTAACFPCMAECLTCTNASNCVTCDASLNRQLISTKFCPCKDRFVDVSGVCVPCLYECIQCTAISTCVSCNLTAFRRINSSNRCICNNGYFDDATNELCPKCTYACLTCVTTAIKCTTCDTNLRVINSNWCECPAKFFDNNITVACLNCHYTCQTCLAFNTCTLCSTANSRIFDSINQYCICSIGFFDDGVNQTCKACDYKCNTCTNATVCLTCSSSSFRNIPASMCPCVSGYYDNGVNICLRCHYSCSTCTNGSQCLSCNALVKLRQFDLTSLCKCSARFYDDLANQLCQPCLYSCLTCNILSSNCTTCTASAFRILESNNCNCMQRYYDNSAQICLVCHYTCLTCIQANKCRSCSTTNFREIDTTDSLCKCMNRYWNNGTAQLCLNCQPSCLTCTDTIRCISCDSARNRMLNTTTNIYLLSSTFCVCKYRFYSLSTIQDCYACHYSCEVCTGPQRNKCVYCNATSKRTLSNSSCLCNLGFYDDLSFEFCQTCHAACAKCTTGLPNSCTICSPLYYLLIATTGCFTICPDYYYNYQLNFTCELCSSHCKSCLNSSYCSQCETVYLLYENECFSACPRGTYSNTVIGVCIDCPKGCSSCTGNSLCLDCYDEYYFNSGLGFCFSCSSNCKQCTGPGQNQCTSCLSPYILVNGTSCSTLICSSGRYVDPLVGCKNCQSLYVGSLTCTYFEPLSCSVNFRLINKTCVFCTSIAGYRMSNNVCTEICGDGVLYNLQCDDGNTISGDGCSSNCLIQNGWICTQNSTNTSVCNLIDALSLQLIKYTKSSGQNKIDLHMNLNLPVIITSNHITIAVTNFTLAEFKYTLTQSKTDLRSIIITLTYTKKLQGNIFSFGYSRPARRLLQQNGRQLTAISFTNTFTISSFPPALFYQLSTINEFTSLKEYLTALSVSLVILCFMLIPKRMHLHNLTYVYIPAQVYLTYGLLCSNQTDWIRYCFQNISYAALKGGIHFGECCKVQSAFFDFSSQIMNISGISMIILVSFWFIYGLAILFHKYCKRISQKIRKFQYFLFTLTLCLLFGIIYSSTNSLYHFALTSKTDTLNESLGVITSICLLVIVIGLWMITYHKTFPLSKANQKIYNLNKDIIQEEDAISQNSKETQGPVSQHPKNAQYGLQFFDFDYIQLYNHRILKRHDDKVNVVFSKAKYFLPMMITKMYVTALLASLLQAAPLYYFAIQCLIQLSFIIFLLLVRPFRSTFTNIRILLVSLLIVVADIVMFIYLYESQSQNYVLLYEKIIIYLIVSIFAIAVLFLFVQHLLAWKFQIISIIEPCLKGLRLLGTKRKSKFDEEEVEASVKSNVILMTSTKRQSLDGQLQNSEQLDAFYARMLKKEQLNKQYRRLRVLK